MVHTEEATVATLSRERALGSQAGRGALWAVLANVTMRFASVAVTALLARLLSKEDFGVFAIALAVYLVVSCLAELGMGSAVARSPMEPDKIAPTVASISIMISTGASIALAACAPVLASALGQPAAAEPIRVLSLCLLLTGVFAVPGAQLVRDFRQDRIFLATVVGFVVGNPVLILLALNGGGATAFAWSRVIGQVATGLVFVFSTSRRYWPGWRRDSVGALLRFGLPLSAANLVNLALLNADYMILGRVVDAAQVGIYLIAFNIANWSTAVMGSVLNSVVVPAFGRVSEDRHRLATALTSASELVALVAFFIGAMTLALSQPLVLTIFGPKWSDAAPVQAVLSLYGILYAFSLLFANVLVATGKTLRLLGIQLSWVAILVPAILISVRLGGLEGVAWAHVLTIGLLAVPGYALAVLRVTGQPGTQLLGACLRPGLAAAIAGAGAWLTSQAFTAPWLSLLSGGFVGGVIFLAVVGPVAVQRLPDRFVPAWLPPRFRRASSLEERQ
jgi:O-antigen/teichoic acid export membrane protein